MRVAIIGGGAAGFFAAITCKEKYQHAKVVIYEKSKKYLSKVKVSGGGRCNVTHNCQYVSDLVKNYPRGGKKLKKIFKQFNNHHTVEWFNRRGVELKTEADGRMFPKSDNSQTIIDCLVETCNSLDIDIRLKCPITSITKTDHGLQLKNRKGLMDDVDRVIICTGGSNKKENYQWLSDLGHVIIDPIPSLFTFNMPSELVTSLMGVVVPDARISLVGENYKSQGPVLITHWGMSGPGILVLSAWAARSLHNKSYQYEVAINWTTCTREDEVKELFKGNTNKLLKNDNPIIELPNRFWQYLIKKSGCDPEQTWQNQPKKNKNKLLKILYYDIYKVEGKTTFKEEFVTCGGVSLDSIELNTMKSKSIPEIYFAGEVLDIDAVTGGFNFQAAWTTGFIAGQLN